MTKDLQEIKSILTEILTNHKKVLKFKGENSSSMEASGTIKALQGKRRLTAFTLPVWLRNQKM